MQKHNHIKALFFLGIFSLLILHDIIPHTHHQHEFGHSNSATAHSANHLLENENSEEGLLDWFVDVHEHSTHSNETVVSHENCVKQRNVKKDVNTIFFVYQYSISTYCYNDTEKVSSYYPPDTYSNNYLSSLDSRGPPSLG